MMTRPKLLAGLSLLCFGLGFLGYTILRAQGYLSIVPYSATERMLDPKTGRQLALTTTIVRSDGSMAQKINGSVVAIWDLKDKTETAIDPLTQSYVVAPLLSHRIPRFTNKPARCEDYFSNGSARQVTCTSKSGETMFGHPLVSVDLKTTAPNPRTLTEHIYAIRNLGWLVVKREIYNEKSELISLYEVVDLREGEPNPAEFTVPAGFRSMGNFVEWAKARAAARQEEFTQHDADFMLQKWNNIVTKARAEGDDRF